MMDTGAIRNKKALEAIRFTSGIIWTKHTENISPGSIHTKYYQPQRLAVETINEVVINFFNHIRKNKYFNQLIPSHLPYF